LEAFRKVEREGGAVGGGRLEGGGGHARETGGASKKGATGEMGELEAGREVETKVDGDTQAAYSILNMESWLP